MTLLVEVKTSKIDPGVLSTFCLRCPVMTHGDSGLRGAAIECNGPEFGDWVWVFSLLLVICVTMGKVTVAHAIPPWGSTVAVGC